MLIMADKNLLTYLMDETIKAFVERLKEKERPVKIGNEWKAVVTDEDIDEFVKEVCGDD